MPGLRRRNLWWLIGLAVVLVAGTGIAYTVLRPAKKTTATTPVNDNRQKYANLYQAAWRQDDGRDSTLVTATLLVPPTITALGVDTGRSSTEDQLWNVVKTNDAKTIPIVLTVDSVSGSVADDTIQKSLTLKTDAGSIFRVVSWRPLIAPSRIVNTSGNASSQIGVAMFATDQAINWQAIGTLTLTVSGIGGEKERTFTWTEPKLLLEL